MRHTLSQLFIFYHIVDLGSFTKAAKYLNVSKAFVSKQITHLEKTHGVSLLQRNARFLQPTLAGEALFQHSRKIVLEYQQAQFTLSAMQEKAAGLLRVSAPTAYAAHKLAHQLPKFLNTYPDVNLDLVLTGEKLNLLKEKIDVAIRLTHTPPEDSIAKLIGYYQLQICASKAFLQNHPALRRPQQLTDVPCFVYATLEESERWPFIIDGKHIDVFVKPRLSCNAYESILQAVLNGCGIARLPSYVIEQAVKQGDLVILYQAFMPPEIPIYAIYAQDLKISPRVSAFINFLLENR